MASINDRLNGKSILADDVDYEIEREFVTKLQEAVARRINDKILAKSAIDDSCVQFFRGSKTNFVVRFKSESTSVNDNDFNKYDEVHGTIPRGDFALNFEPDLLATFDWSSTSNNRTISRIRLMTEICDIINSHLAVIGIYTDEQFNDAFVDSDMIESIS